MRLILFSVLALLFCSCSYRLVHKSELVTGNETVIIERDTTIYLPSAVVRDTLIFRDSIFTLNERVIVDSTGKAELKFYKDRLGRIIAQCTAKKDTVIINNINKTERVNSVKYLEKDLPLWVWLVVGALVILSGLFVLIILRR